MIVGQEKLPIISDENWGMKLPWNIISALAAAIMSKVFSSFHHYHTASHILNTKKNKFLLLVDKSFKTTGISMIFVYGTLVLKP